jgi:DNA-directed RNA polymerase subunit RPC12/RpoP
MTTPQRPKLAIFHHTLPNGDILRLVRADEYAKLETERDAYKAETEWLCETCNTVFLPSELNSGTMCLICKKCGHIVRPKDKVEIKNLKAERDAARAEVEALKANPLPHPPNAKE